MRTGLIHRTAHGRLQVYAVSRPSGGVGPGPDPFDRHSSPRDRQSSQSHRANVPKGKNFSNTAKRRQGRPAHLRSPDDSPLRDGNRDRLVGLLTERAAKTLLVYLQEMNPTVYQWLFYYLKENEIPLTGAWDEVSGDAFLRKMLSMAPETARFGVKTGENVLFDKAASIDVDPRQLAQRIMEIRVQLSREFIQDLSLISDENSVLLRETLQASLANVLAADPHPELPPRDVSKVFVHPELLTQGGALHPEVAESHPELLPVVRKQAELKAGITGGGDTPTGTEAASKPVAPTQPATAPAKLEAAAPSKPAASQQAPAPVPENTAVTANVSSSGSPKKPRKAKKGEEPSSGAPGSA